MIFREFFLLLLLGVQLASCEVCLSLQYLRGRFIYCHVMVPLYFKRNKVNRLTPIVKFGILLKSSGIGIWEAPLGNVLVLYMGIAQTALDPLPSVKRIPHICHNFTQAKFSEKKFTQ